MMFSFFFCILKFDNLSGTERVISLNYLVLYFGWFKLVN